MSMVSDLDLGIKLGVQQMQSKVDELEKQLKEMEEIDELNRQGVRILSEACQRIVDAQIVPVGAIVIATEMQTIAREAMRKFSDLTD